MKPTEPISYLERETRRRSLRRPIWLAAGGLTLTALAAYAAHPTLQKWPESPGPLAIWGVGIMVTAIAVGISLKRRQATLQRIALQLDEQLGTKNRLEAAAELSGSESPLARAQRENAGEALMATPPRRNAWLALGVTVLILAALANGGILGTWVWHRPPVVGAPPPKEEQPTAEFKWKTPESELKATQIEEVPLAAELRSSHGVNHVTLEIAVNGQAKKSIELPDQAAGTKSIDVSLYLDELEVEPFDVVAYHLRAERKFSRRLSATLSPLQFVQVRPFRDDAKLQESSGGQGDECLALLKKLKVAQLRLMKENFVLDGSELARTEEVWKQENQRVGQEQDLLSTKTREAVEFMIEQQADTLIVDNLMQADPLMKSAAELILKIKNAKAAPHQGKALALIVECEKLFVKAILQGPSGQAPPPKVSDPFKDKQQYKLKPRESTAAGQLEEAAKKQAELFKELTDLAKSDAAGKEGGKPNPGELAQKQAAISEKLGEAAGSGELPEEVAAAVREAQQSAEKSAEQLKAHDAEAATEPAGTALKQVQAALAQMKQAGEKQAAEALAQAQQDYNKAAGEAEKSGSSGKTGEELKAAGDKLFAEAERQQAAGSREAAEALAKLAKASAKAGDQLKPSDDGAGGRKEDQAAKALAKLAMDAAAQRMKLQPSAEARAQAMAELRRAQANLAKAASGQGKPVAGPGKEESGQGKAGTGPGQAESGQAPSESGQGQAESGQGQGTSGSGESGAGQGPAAAKLREELRQDALGALQTASLMAQTPEEQKLVSKLMDYFGGTGGGGPGDHGRALPPLAEAGDSLNRLIEMLAAAQSKVQRDEILTEMDPQEAPAKYREAVARYFEKLSKDYQKEASKP